MMQFFYSMIMFSTLPNDQIFSNSNWGWTLEFTTMLANPGGTAISSKSFVVFVVSITDFIVQNYTFLSARM